MLDYSLLEALVVVVREQNFHRAAKKLFLTQSAVSQRIRSLEQQVGQPVIVRSTPVRPTELGNQLVSHFHQVTILEHSLNKRVAMQKEVGRKLQSISIAINTESLATWFIDALKPLLESEEIVVELFVEDQDQTIKLLRAGKVLGCVTSAPKSPHGCKSTYLGKMVYRCVAAPKFISKFFGQGFTAQAAYEAPAAIFGPDDLIHEEYLQKCFRRSEPVRPVYTFVPSPEGLLKFALKGYAYSLLPDLMIAPHLRKKELIDLMPEKPFDLPLYWQSVELESPLVLKVSKSILKAAEEVMKR